MSHAHRPPRNRFLGRLKMGIILLSFAVLFWVAGIRLRERFEVLYLVERQIAAVEREIRDQEYITVELMRQREIIGAPGQLHREHVRLIARDLGMVYRDEIIFRPR